MFEDTRTSSEFIFLKLSFQTVLFKNISCITFVGEVTNLLHCISCITFNITMIDTFKSELHDENSSESDDNDNDDDNGEQNIERNWICHEESKPLTTEQRVTVNLGDIKNVKEIKIGASLFKVEAK